MGFIGEMVSHVEGTGVGGARRGKTLGGKKRRGMEGAGIKERWKWSMGDVVLRA